MKFYLLFAFLVGLTACSEINVTVKHYQACSAQMNVKQYMKIKTTAGFLYVNKVTGETCEAVK